MAQSFVSDNGYAGKSSIGLVVLSTDETLEPEMKIAFSEAPHSLYHSRIPFDHNVTPETLARMEAALPTTLSLFPKNLNFRAIGFGCTSGATVIGADTLRSIIQADFPNAQVSDPITAALAAFNHLGIKKIGLVTPYRLDVSNAMIELFEKNGVEIASFVTFEEEEDAKVAKIAETSVTEAMLEVGQSDCDAVFSSCTNLRSFNAIPRAEGLLDKPVISSNSALAWHLAKLSGAPITPNISKLF